MKKGFTLVELLVVIIILAVIALIATPIAFNLVEESRLSAIKSSIAGYADAMNLGVSDYIYNNQGNLPVIDEEFINTYKPSDEEVVCEEIYSTDVFGIVLNNCQVETSGKYCFASGNHYTCDDLTYLSMLEYAKTGKIKPEIVYQDESGANRPELLTNMVPIKYESDNWVYADISEEWYDYNSKQWANAVILNDSVTKTIGDIISEDDIALWYVWIPRYKYIMFNGNNGNFDQKLIGIEFTNDEKGTVTCTDALNSTGISQTCSSITNGVSTYINPAFTFGEKELTGIWVGKFENSGTIDSITIKPNEKSLRSTTVSDFFTAIQNIKTTYNITDADSHMMKNSEWGAVAYLKQSKYGLGTTDIGINNSSNYITGCGTTAGSRQSTNCNTYDTTGMVASTTGNIYGIYDMSGGAWEYVMGNMVNQNGQFYSSKAGFTTLDSKYYDLYTYGSSNVTHSRGKLGDATKETLALFGSYTGGLYNDYANFVNSSSSWFIRGGSYSFTSNAGIFAFGTDSGGTNASNGSRSVLIKQ